MNDQFESNYGLLVRPEEKGRGVLEALTDKLWGNANSRMEMSATPAQDVYEIRPREERDGFDLISDRLRFGPIWYAGLDAVRLRGRVREVLLSLSLAPDDHPRA